ncbi:hypothetical protein [Nocardia sp. NPDC048505]|uniref:hypothetical protein n=1 Tax=unclassified Nocardia TaxID=2637762 RepID=UPI0033FB96F4
MTTAKKLVPGILTGLLLGAALAAPAAADPIPLGPPSGTTGLLPAPLACLASTGSALFCLGVT